MTVREALTFAAQLKLPGSMSHAEKEQRALDIAELLNLQKSLDNVVGSAMLKGISGGSWPAPTRGYVCGYPGANLGKGLTTSPTLLCRW